MFEHAGIPQDRRATPTDADRKKIEAVIPAAYAGVKVELQLDAYAEDMARKVRLSYPTQVLGRLMETDQRFKLPSGHEATVKLLKNATPQGFRLGETPVSTFLKSTAGVQGGLSDAEFQAAGQQLKVLQRVYQITPSNETMPVLMSLGMTSAFDVMAYPEEQFIALFKAKYLEIYKKPAPVGVPELVSRKAKQVSSVTYNLFTIAKKLDTEPPVAGLSAPVQVLESVKNELLKHYPTMESLFGSMDYCECEHCRSVLSPAAYLVDLLQFVDTEPAVWGNFLAQWKATHGNQDYPNKNAAGEAMKPYDVLIERRPDLPHIALTCENTNTALPYIDIVNEILEYYVAHGKLEKDAARDTDDATTAELLAEPQNVIREAYDALRTAHYPINLPFDLWIETVRQFCDYFETPLHRVLEAFRPKDDLFEPTETFDHAAIFMESLGLSPAELAIFTDPDPLAKWHELCGFASAAEATTEATDATTGQRIDLNSAKALSRRLGVTYKEITEIVQTGFVNPELSKLRLLYKLDVSIADARFYLANKALLQQAPATLSPEEQKRRLEAEAFSQGLADLATTFKVQAATLEAAIQAIPFDRILVLADPDAGCNFDLTTLQYSDGTKANAIVFLRINLFVRLWRKLGWRIEETDRALTTFIPRSALFDGTVANFAKQPLKTALIYLAHLKTLDENLKLRKQSRLKLLTLWSDIATTGKDPLYAQLFLTRGVLKTAPVFDNPLGKFLQYFDGAANAYTAFRWNPAQPEDPATGNVSLRSHLLAVQGALGLTADEISRILADAGKSLDTAELSLANVSLLYRYGLLAKALKLTQRELIALKQFSGLDPFKPLSPDPLAALDQDHPFSQTLEFVKVVEEVKASGLKIEDLDYLLRHRFDETGKYRPNRDTALAMLKMLAEGVRAILGEHAVPDDPGALSDEALRQKLGLALPADVVATFTAMMNRTAEFAVTRAVASADQLHPVDFAGESSITLSPYDSTKNQQTLVYRGVLFDPEKADLKTKFGGKLAAGPKATFEALLDDAQTKAQQEAHAFFDKHLLKQAGGIQPASGFLDATDYDLLFAPAPAVMTEEQQQAREREKRGRLAQAFMPFLQRRLIRQFIVQTMIAQTGTDPVLLESLVADDRFLANPKSLLEAYTATAERALSATFWTSADATGAALPAVSLVDADTGARDKDGNPLKPAGANSARLEAYLEVPASGAYRFSIELDKQNAEAELRFPHRPEPLFLNGAAAAEPDTIGDQPEEFLELKAGVLYRFSLDLKRLNGGDARLLVQGETLPKGALSQLTLYPAAAIDAAVRATTLLNKALQLIQGLDLSEREIRYLLTYAADFDNLSLSEMPTANVGDSPAEKTATTQRFARFRRLASYARLKRDLAGGTDDLIGIFEANGTTAADKLLKQVYPLIAKLTHREEATVKATAEALVKAPAVSVFESEKPLLRLWEALQVVERFGVPPTSLLEWTDIVNSTTTGARRFDLARDLKEAIKARFEPESWQRVAQPIFDKLRQRQRDALVSHVMQQHGFDRMEQLYEYFLIDPGMEPVVQTSRIRLAISSLQLFIQRCLLNLEQKVNPSTINAKQWEWMKRYRVWEANRKIFLFPENWLEPEFRDDKTHLFTELEGALLQGDVSSDLVEDAFLNYLRKLDELARLDIVAMHVEDNSDPALRILHVFGRTYSQPHKYFYRRYAHQMWTPWEPVNAEIEGDHLAPVAWRDRLYLFWVTFMDKADPNPSTGSATGSKKITDVTLSEVVTDLNAVVADKQVEVHLHWSEYLHGEWSTREFGGFSPLISKTVPASFNPSSVFIHVSKEYDLDDGAELGVFVHMGGSISRAFYLAGRNSAPESQGYGSKPINPFNSANTEIANRYSGIGALKVSYQERITTEPGKTPPKANPSILQRSLQSGGSYKIVPCNNNLLPLGISEGGVQKPRQVVANFGYDAGGWRVDRHPRFLADLTGDGRADIVGFGNAGVWVALNNGDGTFQAPQMVINNFGYNAGGWRVDQHPRFLADLTGDGRADIVGFGNAGVWVALNNGDSTFQAPQMVIDSFGYNAGGWRVDQHPRFLADLTGDGRADIVGFGNAGVWVALNNGDSTFQAPQMVVANFGYDAGGWRVDQHPRFLADLTGDGRADIVGFGNAGVWVALNNGDGTFKAPQMVINNFGYNAGGWRVDRHPRFLADLTGDGRADIVGFGNAGVWVALNNGDGTFQAPQMVVANFGYNAGGWRVARHPRFLADLNIDGRADIVGFGNAGVWVALNNGDGTFQAPQMVVDNFGYVANAGGWRVDRHPRFLADLTGDGRADIVGFGNAGVWFAVNYGAIGSGYGEIASLIKPVFYQDNRHTLFVEPNLTERTIEEWQEWVTRVPQPEPGWQMPDWWDDIVVIPEFPWKWTIPDPGDSWHLSIDPGSLINPVPDRDWLVNPGSVMKFGDVLIGPKGQPGIEIRVGGDPTVGQGLVNISPGSDLASGNTIVLRDEGSFAKSGLKGIGGGLNIVGGAGFNSALERNFTDMNRSGFGTGAPGVRLIGR